jgi:hypothetical protein
MEHGDPMPECEGGLIRAHLIPRQLIARVGGRQLDRRSYVLACGGLSGLSGHHGMFDSSKKLRVAREELPPVLFEFADELGLGWYIERTYALASHQGAPLEAAPPGDISTAAFQGAIAPDIRGVGSPYRKPV